MKVLSIEPLANECPLACVPYNVESRPFGLTVTDRALYFCELDRWSLKEPWVIRRLPNEQVKHVTVRRTRPLPIRRVSVRGHSRHR